MRQADPDRDYRALVARGYDFCAPAFNEARAGSDEHLLVGLRERLQPGSRILDLGCGGLPVSRTLAKEHSLVGVDISRAQIQLARRVVSAGSFIIADMTDVAFRPQSFDAVVSFYAIFHTPRSGHGPCFGASMVGCVLVAC